MITSPSQPEEFVRSYVLSLSGTIDRKDETIIRTILKACFDGNKVLEISMRDLAFFTNQVYYIHHFGPFSKMELFITKDCNLQCSYCFVKEKQHHAMSFETACDAINFLVFFSGAKRQLEITFFGGEPLLEFDLICSLIEYSRKIEDASKQKKIGFAITTNGTLIDEKIMKALSGKVNLLLSLDGDEETHDRYRRFRSGEGSYRLIASKIKMMKKFQPWLGARMTVLPSTVPELFNNVLHLYQMGINQFIIGMSVESEWDEHALKILEGEYEKISSFYLKAIQAREALRMTFFEDGANERDQYKDTWGCRAGRSSITVDAGGDIYPCSKFIGLEKNNCPELTLGNIYEGITNIALSRKMNKMKNEDYEKCINCKEVDNCSGGCPADNYFENRNLYMPAKAGCGFTRINNHILKEFRTKC